MVLENFEAGLEQPSCLEAVGLQQAGRRSAVTAWIGGPRIHCGYHASGYVHMYSPHSFTSGHGAMGMTHVHDDGILPPRAVQVVLNTDVVDAVVKLAPQQLFNTIGACPRFEHR